MKKIVALTVVISFMIIGIMLIQSLLFDTLEDGRTVVEKSVDAPFLQDIQQDVVVMFFGYVGCTDICTPMLERLSTLFENKELKERRGGYQFVFVNLTPNINKNLPQQFAQSFNKDFVGVHLSRRELLSIGRAFTLFFSDSLTDKNEINHTDYVYILKRDKKGKFILKNIYSTRHLFETALVNDLLMSIER